GSVADGNITTAMAAWASVVTFVAKGPGDNAYIEFGPAVGSCSSAVGHSGARQTVACALRTQQDDGGPIALIHQAENLVDALFIDGSGDLRVATINGDGFWELPRVIGTHRGVVRGRVSVARQNENVVVAAFIDTQGALTIAHAVDDGPWNPTFRVGPVGVADPG